MTVTGIPEDAGMYQFLRFLFILALSGVLDGVDGYAYICPWLFDSMFASYTPYVWNFFCEYCLNSELMEVSGPGSYLLLAFFLSTSVMFC